MPIEGDAPFPKGMEDFMNQFPAPGAKAGDDTVKNKERFEGLDESAKPAKREGIVSKSTEGASSFSADELENIQPGLSTKSPFEVLQFLAKKEGHNGDFHDLPIEKVSSEIEKIGIPFGGDEGPDLQENLYKSGDFHLKTKTINGKECYVANVNFEAKIGGKTVRWTQEVQTSVEVPKSKSMQKTKQKHAFMLINCYKDVHFEDPINKAFVQKPNYIQTNRSISDRKIQQMSLSNIKLQVKYDIHNKQYRDTKWAAPIKSIYLQDDLSSTKRYQKMTVWKPRRPRQKFNNYFSERLNFIKSPQMSRLFERHEQLRLDAKQASRDFKNFALHERAKAMKMYEKVEDIKAEVDDLKEQLQTYEEELEKIEDITQQPRIEGLITETKAMLEDKEKQLNKSQETILEVDTQLQFIKLLKKSRKKQMMGSIDQSADTSPESTNIDMGGLNKGEQEKLKTLKKLIDGYDSSPILDAYRELATSGSTPGQFKDVLDTIDEKLNNATADKELAQSQLKEAESNLEDILTRLIGAEGREEAELEQQLEEQNEEILVLQNRFDDANGRCTQLEQQREFTELLQRQKKIKNKLGGVGSDIEGIKELTAEEQNRLEELKEMLDTFEDSDLLKSLLNLKSGSPYTEFKRISAQIQIEMSVFDRINKSASIFNKDHSYEVFAESKIHVTREKRENVELEVEGADENVDLGFDVDMDDITKDIFDIQEGFGADVFDNVITLPKSAYSTIKKFENKDIDPMSDELRDIINQDLSKLQANVATAYANSLVDPGTLSEEELSESQKIRDAFLEGYEQLTSGQNSEEDSKKLISFLKTCASTFDFESDFSLSTILELTPDEQAIDHVINWIALGGTMDPTGEMGLDFDEFLTLNTKLDADTIEITTKQGLSYQSSLAFVRLCQDRMQITDENVLEIGLNLKDDKGFTALQRMVCETPTDQLHKLETIFTMNPDLAVLSADDKTAVDYLIERIKSESTNEERLYFDDFLSSILESMPISTMHDNTVELNKLRSFFNERKEMQAYLEEVLLDIEPAAFSGIDNFNLGLGDFFRWRMIPMENVGEMSEALNNLLNTDPLDIDSITADLATEAIKQGSQPGQLRDNPKLLNIIKHAGQTIDLPDLINPILSDLDPKYAIDLVLNMTAAGTDIDKSTIANQLTDGISGYSETEQQELKESFSQIATAYEGHKAYRQALDILTSNDPQATINSLSDEELAQFAKDLNKPDDYGHTAFFHLISKTPTENLDQLSVLFNLQPILAENNNISEEIKPDINLTEAILIRLNTVLDDEEDPSALFNLIDNMVQQHDTIAASDPQSVAHNNLEIALLKERLDILRNT